MSLGSSYYKARGQLGRARIRRATRELERAGRVVAPQRYLTHDFKSLDDLSRSLRD